MKLQRLVYISDAKNPFTRADLTQLVSSCRESNRARGISGILLYSGGHFMQMLEGQGMQISSLFSKISLDPRHCNVEQLMFRDADDRIFPEWGMELARAENAIALDRTRIEQQLLRLRLKQSAEPVADAISLLREFRNQVMGSKVA